MFGQSEIQGQAVGATLRSAIRSADREALGRIEDRFTISGNVSRRLSDFCGLDSGEEAPEGISPSFPQRVTAPQLEALLSGDEPPLLVDVRELWEWEEGNLEALGAIHLPLSALNDALPALPRDRPIVAVCSMGARSAGAADYLRGRGLPRVANLAGGLAVWAEVVDPELRVV